MDTYLLTGETHRVIVWHQVSYFLAAGDLPLPQAVQSDPGREEDGRGGYLLLGPSVTTNDGV